MDEKLYRQALAVSVIGSIIFAVVAVLMIQWFGGDGISFL